MRPSLPSACPFLLGRVVGSLFSSLLLAPLSGPTTRMMCVYIGYGILLAAFTQRSASGKIMAGLSEQERAAFTR